MSKQQQLANMALISDNIFKFLIVDEVSLQFLLQHDCEQNIRLFRRCTAQQIAQTVTQQHLEEIRQHNVDKLAVSFGTVDLRTMHFTRESPEVVAETIASALTELATTANKSYIQLLYVIPGYTYSITPRQYTVQHCTSSTPDVCKHQQHLKSNSPGRINQQNEHQSLSLMPYLTTACQMVYTSHLKQDSMYSQQ